MVIIKTWGGRCLVSLPFQKLFEKHLARNATGNAPPPQKTQHKPHDTQTKQREKHLRNTHASADEKKKNKTGAGTLVKENMKMNGSRAKRMSAMKRHKKNPKLGFPQRLRKRERERETKNVTTNTKTNKGARFKKHQTKQYFNPEN